ncbi:PspC domain-containing protein [Aeromicrobium duanguangcaii]|uniref:PspC domain-containing protein n=1 Tax=Aeromicrobium duanguangcaii TaxID=2968086 RepID=A0ABY5KG17_9ACTN|nr:PspC domain-containing protein [Aeromicrobium duanguangcaii]MCD9155272.1 PspC domain-containing protein [Aeromicrobium duanguangcaii]MCL3838623.1 PspC domain-containing protein [Aeromicrobium duanguangcaii]UUI68077.1 PspC domain-containing protein [Aeromicrobium duanguangcaii]
MTSPPSAPSIESLRRSDDEKMIAGVASGLARTFDIDPVIVRIAFVVLTVIGFSGPLLYLACWLLIPREGAQRSALGDAFDLQSDSHVRTVGLIVAGVLAVAAVLGDQAWGGPWLWAGWIWMLFWIAAPIAAVYWFVAVRPRRSAPAAPVVPPPPYRPEADAEPPARPFSAPPSGAAYPSTPAGENEMTTPVATDEATAVLGEPGPPTSPPPGPPTSVVPPRPPREKWSPALLLVTLSAIIAAMGGLGLWSVLQEPVDVAVYPAVALAIVAVGLFVGTRIGHPGALVLVGLLILPVLAAASFVPNLSAGDVDLRPTSAAAVPEEVELGFGQVSVDLTAVQDLDALAGRRLAIDHGMGETTVVVPRDLDVAVEASLTAGGQIDVFDEVRQGRNPRLDRPSDAPGALVIDINGTAGEITVVRR